MGAIQGVKFSMRNGSCQVSDLGFARAASGVFVCIRTLTFLVLLIASYAVVAFPLHPFQEFIKRGFEHPRKAV